MIANNSHTETVQEIDAALHNEVTERASDEQLKAKKSEAQQRKIGRIGMLLRVLGSIVLLAGAGTFLFQRWGEMSHLVRYLSFLGFTAGVCAAGLLCGLGIKENKGARTLLAIVASLIPVHFAQLGALLFSQTPEALTPSYYPQYFYWAAPTLGDALLALACGVTALIPMAFMSYSVLVRQHAKRFLYANLLASAVLLVPSRDPLLISLLIGLVGTMVLMADRKVSNSPDLKTVEGVIARLLPFAALSLTAARQFFLYNAAEFIVGSVLALGTAALYGPIRRVFRNEGIVGTIEVVSLASASVACFLLVDTLQLPSIYRIASLGIVGCLVLSVMGTQARVVGKLYQTVAAVVLIWSAGAECTLVGIEASIISLVMGLVAVTVACIAERKVLLAAGLCVVSISLGDVVVLALRSVTISPWLTLGTIGVSTVLAASYLERNFVRLAEIATQSRARLASWK